MATINEAGAAVKTLRSYLDEVQQAYRDIDSGWNIEPESPDGQAIAIWSELLANLDEAVIAAYRSVDPSTAIGEQLDRIARISGLDRKEGTSSTATVTFTGTNGTGISAGTEVRNVETGTKFSTDEFVEITGGEASVGVTANVIGPETAGPGDLSEIATPIGGVSSVTNAASASLGDPVETDVQLRRRRRLSVAAPGANIVDSMFGSIANLDDVKHVRVYENTQDTADSNGVAPHSLAIFVDGGDTTEVAETIANNKTPGTGLNADNTYTNKVQESVKTEQGSNLDVTFYRPELLDVFVDVTLEGDVSQDKQDEVKQAIVDYAAGTLLSDVTGWDRTGFGIGEVVPAGKLYTAINKVVESDGFVVDVKVGTSSSPTSNTVDPGFNGLAVFDTGNISVTLQ